MFYSSFLRSFIPREIIQKRFEAKMKYYAAHNIIPGIGLIAPGIYAHEPVYGAKELKEELKIVRERKMPEVVIFRLGGLNTTVASVINNFCD